MGEVLEDKCGICLTHSLHDAYSFLKSLQHRGRDSAGIAAIGKKRIDVIKWVGSVDKFSLEKIVNIFNETNSDGYHTFLGHVRYATKGKKDNILMDCHPITTGGKTIDNNSHLFQLDCLSAGVHNGQASQTIDQLVSQNLNNESDTVKLLEFIENNSADKAIETIDGSFVFLFADKNRDYIDAIRDRHGIMPAVIGKKDGKYVLASEDIALRKNGAQVIKNMEPGSMYRFFPNGEHSYSQIAEQSPKHCFFQWNYIGNSQSSIEDISVWSIRRRLGETLAETIKPDLDVVSFLPDCPEIAAMAYAEKRELPYKEIFYKIREERAFQGKDAEARKDSIGQNLQILPIISTLDSEDYLKNKKIGLIDDSIIRGNNALHARDLLQEKGASEIHLISYTPMVGIVGSDNVKRGCEFGIDMPPDDRFIARGRTEYEISEAMGMTVHYLPYEKMLEVFREKGMPQEKLCKFCIGGEHPYT